MFEQSVEWEGGALYNEENLTIEESDFPMSLRLEPDGTGYGTNLPRGQQMRPDNACIEVSSDELYTGDLTWQQSDESSFEVSFADSRYQVLDGPGKWGTDWSEVRIYTCNWGYEYWRMQMSCAEPDLVGTEIPTCPVRE